MKSLVTLQFIFYAFLLLVTIVAPRKSRKTKTTVVLILVSLLVVTIAQNECCNRRVLQHPHETLHYPRRQEYSKIPKVTIEQITEPITQTKGLHWDDRTGKLYYADTYAQIIYCLHPATGKLTHTYIANGPIGGVVPVEGVLDKFIAGAGTDFVLITWDSDRNCSDPFIEVLGTVDKHKNGTRFSEGKVDSHGRFWAGTMGLRTATSGVMPNLGSLYRLTSDRVIKNEISPVTISNGIAWNKENTTMYYIDTPTLQIAAYDFDARHGKISNKRIIFDFPSHNISGKPNGMTIDINDNLWVAAINAGLIINVDPNRGKLLQTIEMPSIKVISVTWGGNLFDILYVTSSRLVLTPEQIEAQPKSGSIFAIKGLQTRGFAGNLFSLVQKNHDFH